MRLFMSMLEVKGDGAATQAKYQRIIKAAKNLGYQVIIDANPKLGLTYSDLSWFKQLGVDGIRLDMGFDGASEARMSLNREELIIEFNETNDVDYFNNIMSYEPAPYFLYGCHNFYPQRGTGIQYDYFKRCSERFNIHSAAFVTSQAGKMGTWDFADGLPTLEADRDLLIAVQAKRLFASNLVDDVLIGNAYATDDELAALAAVNCYQTVFALHFAPEVSALEREIVLRQHERRGDINAMTIRLTQSRNAFRAAANPDRPHGEFQPGDVLIGNDDFGVYKNELQIVLKAHSDARKNYVGHIDEAEVPLLEFGGRGVRLGLKDKIELFDE